MTAPVAVGGTTALNAGLRAVAGWLVAEVRITPVTCTRDGGHQRMWAVCALDSRGGEIPPPGVAVQVVNLIRRAFPLARWGRAQDYRLATGVLAEHITRLPAALADGTPGRGQR